MSRSYISCLNETCPSDLFKGEEDVVSFVIISVLDQVML